LVVLPFVLIIYWALIGNGLRTVGQPFLVSSIIYATTLPLWFQSLEHARVKLHTILLFAAGGASIFLLHSQWWAFLGFSLGALGLHLLLRREFNSLFVTAGLIVGLLSLSAPIFLLKYEFYGQIAGSINEVIFERFLNAVYYVGDLYAFKITSLPAHFIIFGIVSIGMLGYGFMKGYRNFSSGGFFGALLIAMILFVVLNPLIVPLISELATINTLSRLSSLGNFWGILLLSFLIGSLWPSFKTYWDNRTNIHKLVISGVGAIGTLAILLIQPLLQFGVGIQSPTVRQRVASILTENFGVPEDLLRTLVSNLPLVTLIGSLVVASLLLVILFILRNPFLRLLGRVEQIEPQMALSISLPVVLIVLLVLPSTEISPFKARVQDNLYAQLYGPTLSQVSGNEQFEMLFGVLPQGSLITTDARNLFLAHRDIMITGDIHGLVPDGREINDFIQPLFELETPTQEVLERLIDLRPQYLVLSPRYSHLAWMKYDHYSSVLNKVYDQVISEIDYYNNRFVVYEVDSNAAQQAREDPEFAIQSVGAETEPENCEINRLFAPYIYDLQPRGWNPKGNELLDGIWNSTANSLLWVPPRVNWFYIEFDLGADHYIDRVEVKNHHFSSSYRLLGLRLYESEDGAYYQQVDEIKLEGQLDAGDHHWAFENVNRNVRALRIAINSESSTTIGEIEIYGCLIGE